MVRGRGGKHTPPRIAEILQHVITDKGQSEVEKQLGLSHSMISRYKRGIGEPSSATVEKLAAFFKTSPVWLRGGSIYRNCRVSEFLGKMIFEQGQLAVVKEMGLQKAEIVSYCCGEVKPGEKIKVKLANFLNMPVDHFESYGWDEFYERLPRLLDHSVFMKGRFAVEKQTGIPLYIIDLCYKRLIEPSEEILDVISKSYNVSVEYLRGNQRLKDEIKLEVEALFTSIEWIKSYSSDHVEIGKYIEAIEESAKIILQELDDAKLKAEIMKDRMRKFMEIIPREEFPQLVKKLQDRLQE